MKRSRIIDLTICAAIALLVGFALAPALARIQRSSGEAKCQSNLRRWAQAMSAYLADNHLRYPTNRLPRGGALSPVIQLSPDPPILPPAIYDLGVTWVEALYPYLQSAAARTSQDWRSFRLCPNVRNMADPPFPSMVGYASARMSYALNFNLVEQHTGIVRDPGIMMMLREMDRRVNSILRPSYLSMDSATRPANAFLNSTDTVIGSIFPVEPNRHGSGSYICFADGHIKYFTTGFYPQSPVWDSTDQRWYNFTTGPYAKTIAVSP